jgi:uncharacterized damage-inducible protein DinB
MNADQARFLVEYFANLMENEGQTTAKVLAAVPNDRRDYKPDAKSRSAWELAKHLATGDVWFVDSIIKGAFVFDPNAPEPPGLNTVEDVVAYYQREYPAKLKALRALPAEKLTEIVDFFGMFKWPNAAYLGFANNHGIHHRGQLASYLRAMGSKVPSIYGGSADEPMGA